MKLIINEQMAVRLLAVVALSCLTMLTYTLIYSTDGEGRVPTMQNQKHQQTSPDEVSKLGEVSL